MLSASRDTILGVRFSASTSRRMHHPQETLESWGSENMVLFSRGQFSMLCLRGLMGCDDAYAFSKAGALESMMMAMVVEIEHGDADGDDVNMHLGLDGRCSIHCIQVVIFINFGMRPLNFRHELSRNN